MGSSIGCTSSDPCDLDDTLALTASNRAFLKALKVEKNEHICLNMQEYCYLGDFSTI